MYHPDLDYLLDQKGQVMSAEDSNEVAASKELPQICKFPDWFFDNCIRLADELATTTHRLAIKDTSTAEQNQAQACEANNESANDGSTYQIDVDVYEQLLDLQNTEIFTALDQDQPATASMPFSSGAALLCYPYNSNIEGSSRFLDLVVERFAKDVHADLITLSYDDLEDLQEWFSGWRPLQQNEYWAQKFHTHGYLPTVSYCPKIPFEALCDSPRVKFERSNSFTTRREHSPIILYMPLIDNVMKFLGIVTLSEIYSKLPPNVILLLSCSEHNCRSQVLNGLNDLCPPSLAGQANRDFNDQGCNAPRQIRSGPLYVVPIDSDSQRALLEIDVEAERSHEKTNIRMLQRSMRRLSPQHWEMDLLQSYAQWTFLESSHMQDFLAELVMPESNIRQILSSLGPTRDKEKIKKLLLRYGRVIKVMGPWVAPPKHVDKWSKFPEHIQPVLRDIEAGGVGADSKYHRESGFLSNVINQNELDDGWEDIALEDPTKTSIQRLVDQFSDLITPAYGILKHARIRGALIYGPPGTGKTHLARVLANESKSTMISISAADLIHSYIGESEHAIQALFTFARMLSPSIIFIDEADALFRPRSGNDRSWERNQVNQLLAEMDGLVKHTTSPFVLLATNFPSQLDHALLRRVTSRIHLGLPSGKSRLMIWKICLQEEILDSNVDFDLLVRQSAGYSGSDIQTVCVQAALRCSTFSEEADGSKRLLKLEDFEAGLEMCAPSVSVSTLQDIAAFAKTFDSRASALVSANYEDYRFSSADLASSVHHFEILGTGRHLGRQGL